MYKFTEKERDKETNYDYFGARYYNAKLGRWLSVDPLADKYPGYSPYNYTMGNPLVFIDENGDSVQVAYIDSNPLPGGDDLHAYLILTDEEIGKVTILEGMPEGILGGIVDFVLDPNSLRNGGEGWGNLTKEVVRSPEDAEEIETVSTPEGMTDKEFQQKIIEVYKSYKNDVPYAPWPPGSNQNTGNSNSLIGTSLRGAGSDYTPWSSGNMRKVPGWNVNVVKLKNNN